MSGALAPAGSGWLYRGAVGDYRLSGDPPACALEGWVRSRYHVVCGPPEYAVPRREMAEAIARGDGELEQVVRSDLWHMARAINRVRIECELLDGVSDDPVEDLLVGSVPADPDIELLVLGLPVEGRRRVAKVAARFGGRVNARRRA